MSNGSINKIDINNLPLEARLALFQLELMRRNNYKFIWTTKNSEEIDLKDIELNHLLNIIKLLKNVIEANKNLEAVKDLLPSDLTDIC